MTHPTHKEELHAGTARGLHHLTGRVRGRGGLARMVGTRRTRVSRLARPAAGTGLHDLDGSEHVPSDVRIRHRIQSVGLGRALGATIAELATASKVAVGLPVG